MNDSESGIFEKIKAGDDDKTDEPPMYKVVLYNDDFTPKGFVVELLVKLFHKSLAEATDCQSALKIAPPSASNIDPPQAVFF